MQSILEKPEEISKESKQMKKKCNFENHLQETLRKQPKPIMDPLVQPKFCAFFTVIKSLL